MPNTPEAKLFEKTFGMELRGTQMHEDRLDLVIHYPPGPTSDQVRYAPQYS